MHKMPLNICIVEEEGGVVARLLLAPVGALVGPLVEGVEGIVAVGGVEGGTEA